MEKCLQVLFDRDTHSMLQFLRTRLRDLKRFPFADFIINTVYKSKYSAVAEVPAKKIFA